MEIYIKKELSFYLSEINLLHTIMWYKCVKIITSYDLEVLAHYSYIQVIYYAHIISVSNVVTSVALLCPYSIKNFRLWLNLNKILSKACYGSSIDN